MTETPKENTVKDSKPHGVSVKRLVGNAGQSYFFSNEIVKQYEAGEIEFADANGNILKPSYFGAGLSGMNGTLKAI